MPNLKICYSTQTLNSRRNCIIIIITIIVVTTINGNNNSNNDWIGAENSNEKKIL